MNLGQNPDCPIRRVAVTVPPESWFRGVDRSLFAAYRQALVDLGIDVFPVPVDAFQPPDPIRIEALLEGLRAFRPELAIGIPHGNYGLNCRLAAGRDGYRPNLFCDVLGIPLLCYWDHAPLELADQLLAPHPETPAESRPGAYQALHRVLTHPKLIHWSRDSGQTRVMQELGFVHARNVIQDYSPALPAFQPAPTSGPESSQPSVSFIGYLYQDAPAWPHPELAALAESSVHTWLATPGEALWDVLHRQVAALDPPLRQQLALDPGQTYFWHYAHRLIVHQAQTASRLHYLRAARVPVACYSNLRTGPPGVTSNLLPYPGDIPFGAPLAAVMARHAVTIDVVNPGFIGGFSIKTLLGFASGGFMLVDRRQDFIDVFGDAGEAASYKDADDLGAKLDRLLSRPCYRREVGDAIRALIRQRLQLRDVVARVLQAAAGRLDRSAVPARQPPQPDVETVLNLLPKLRTERQWEGASVEQLDGPARVVTPPKAWAYAALISLPFGVMTMDRPEMRITLRVESGRVGVAVLDRASGALASEQAVGPSPRSVTLTFELPRTGEVGVLFRNTVDKPSSVLVLEAALCNRTA